MNNVTTNVLSHEQNSRQEIHIEECSFEDQLRGMKWTSDVILSEIIGADSPSRGERVSKFWIFCSDLAVVGPCHRVLPSPSQLDLSPRCAFRILATVSRRGMLGARRR